MFLKSIMMNSCQVQIAHLLPMGFLPSYKHSIETPSKEMNQPLLKKKKAPSSAITSMGGHILLLWAKTTAKCSPYPQLEGSGRRPKRSGKAESLPRAVRWQASKQNKKLVTSASQKWCVPGPQEDFFPQPFTLQ